MSLLASLPRLSAGSPHVHPSDANLERFHERTLAPSRHRRIERHLAACASCRDRRHWRVTLGASARALAATPMTDDSTTADATLDAGITSALERRRAGERVLIPAAPTVRPEMAAHAEAVHTRGVSRSAISWAVAASVLVAAVLALPGRREAVAGAAKGRLVLSPAHARSGDTVSAVYHPSAALAGDARIRLRAIFYPANDAQAFTRPAVTAAWLAPDRQGTYRGRFVLPAGAAYARLAVEDSAARHVDAHGGLPWELFAHDADGRPRMDAFRSREIAALPSPAEWERSRVHALEATRVRPDHPSGWRARIAQDRELAGQDRADSVTAAMRPIVLRLDSVLATASWREPWAMSELAGLADGAGERAMGARWRARIVRDAPRSTAAYMARFMATANEARPPELLDSLDGWWQADPDSVAPFVSQSVGLAVAARDLAAARRWAERIVTAEPTVALSVARTLIRDSALAGDGVAYARAALARARTTDDARRPLEATAAAWARSRARTARASLVVVGEGLLTLGRPAEASRALTEATAAGWDGRAFRLLGEARLAAGDTGAAVDAFAHAVADPIEGARLSSMLPGRLGARVAGPGWAEAVSAARRTMHTRVLEETVAIPVLGAPRLTDGAGARQTLGGVTAGRVTVVALVNRGCAPSLAELPAVEQLHRALAQRAVAFVTVTSEARTDDLRDFWRARNFTSTLWHDRDGDIAAAFGANSTPTYLVLDRAGMVRWRGHRIADASPVVDALLEAQPGLK